VLEEGEGVWIGIPFENRMKQGEQAEQRVAEQLERLTTKSLRAIEEEVATKRIRWLAERFPRGGPGGPSPSPQDAFELLFFEYMGLCPDDVPVLHADQDQIVWSSRNPCPTLEACTRLGLDTRAVCRQAYEKSTQAFLSFLDPRLRFLRDYQEIRPYARHCLERIVRVDFEPMMRTAIEEAELSRKQGNKGYGAVVAFGNQVLARAHDTGIVERDPSLHAEVNAIRAAVRVAGASDLSGAVLFSSCEPCPMCSSLAVWANLSAIVFGASIEKTALRGKARICVPAREIVERSPVRMEIIPGVLESECLALY
jgi:tRNA(Arg) A34 adenosine deaminase TadA